MKNIESNIGGRYRYNEDFRSIQNAALSLVEILKDCKSNFVISGCKNNQEGYVWLDGKIRYVPSLDKQQLADYIVCKNSEGPVVLYGNDEQHKLYDEFDAQYSDTKTTPCISKINGNFPTIREYFWEHYGLAKNSKTEQVVKSKTTFNNGIECFKILIGDKTTLSITDNEIIMETPESGISLGTDSPIIYIRRNGMIAASLGGEENENDVTIPSGQLIMPKIMGENFKLYGKINAKEYFLDGGKNIHDVLKASSNHVDTGWVPFNFTKPTAHYLQDSHSCLTARQVKDKVFVRGKLMNGFITNEIDETEMSTIIKYKTLSDNNDYGNILGSFLTHEVDQNGDIADKYLSENERPQIVKLKLNLKLPDEITPPDADKLPGCMIMGLFAENCYERYKSNLSIDSYYSIGNAQLILGNDRFLYLIIGTNHKLYFNGNDVQVNFNYLV